MNQAYWKMLQEIADTHEIVIDRPKGSRHPRFHHIVYPLDYGYLQGTSSMDGSEMMCGAAARRTAWKMR